MRLLVSTAALTPLTVLALLVRQPRAELWIVAALALAVLGFAVAVLLMVKRRLHSLSVAAQRLATGDHNVDMPAGGDDEFGRLGQSLTDLRRHLEETREGRDRVIMSVSHDLKTPLASIKGYTDALREGMAKTPEQREKYLNIIANKTALLDGRIQDLIDFVRLSGSHWPFNAERLPIRAVVEEWFADFSRELSLYDRSIQVDNRLPDDEYLTLDERLLERALENLVSNARLYSPKQEPIWLVARAEATQCVLEVGSVGDAITSEARSQLFEPFYRIDPARHKRGLGLGLTVVRTIAEQQGGYVDYRHEQGINWFSIVLPRG